MTNQDFPDGKILEVRHPQTGTLVGVCSGVREDGATLHVERMILLGSAIKTVPEFPNPDVGLSYWDFDLRDGNRLCYGGCRWDIWEATYSNGESLVVEGGVVLFKEKGRGATDEDRS